MNETPPDPIADLRHRYLISIGAIVVISLIAQTAVVWGTAASIGLIETIFALTMLAVLIEVFFVFEPAVRTLQTQFLDLQRMLATAQEHSNPPSTDQVKPQEVFAVYREANETPRQPSQQIAAILIPQAAEATVIENVQADHPTSNALSTNTLSTNALPAPREDNAMTPKILLVEDNQINQMLAQEVLVSNDWQCDIAENGVEALDAIGVKTFDLILMDCQMPVMDGFSLTREIRARQLDGRLTSRCPIIAVTANALTGHRQKCIDAGMDDYLAKPFNPNQLTEIVEQWLPASTPRNPPRAIAADPAPEAPLPFVRQEFMERCMGDLGFAESLLESFQSDSLARVDEIVQHARQRNATAAGNAAHTLKGMAGILAAHPLQSIAADIEQAGRHDQLDQIDDLIDDLQNEVARCLAYIPKLTQGELESA
ncbi:response regulator [Rosistilla oblonga]|uniref:response regulator n=1 Tax=Rosistilla oblonga TaxID=2527990 RepID=UPI003A982EC9